MSDLSDSLAKEVLKELRSRRRWNTIVKILFATIFVSVFFSTFYVTLPKVIDKEHAGVVEINGMLIDTDPTNADDIVAGIKRAFKNDKVKDVILKINSPGGSPVISDDVYTAIKKQRKEYPKKKIYAVCSDVCASGGYYIAAACDGIYANPASIVGSIGVVASGFGFVGTLEKLGAERRLFTSGKSKGFLDPFSPINKDEEVFFKTLLNDVHQQFINKVKQGRKKKLANDPSIFSGLFWTGNQAKKLGLIDGFGNVSHVTKEIIKVDETVDYTVRQHSVAKILKNLGLSAHSLKVALDNFNPQTVKASTN